MNDAIKFKETSLPDKEHFYDDFKIEDISDDDYARAQEAWGQFEMETMQDYHDLYLPSDVLILADIF